MYWYTSVHTHDLVVRKKETYDNVIASSNAVMAAVLHRMGVLLDRADWISHSRAMVSFMLDPMQRNPAYASAWGIAMIEHLYGLDEVVIAGEDALHFREALGNTFLPFSLHCGTGGETVLPPAAGKQVPEGVNSIYICHRYACQAPVATAEEAIGQLERRKGHLGVGL